MCQATTEKARKLPMQPRAILFFIACSSAATLWAMTRAWSTLGERPADGLAFGTTAKAPYRSTFSRHAILSTIASATELHSDNGVAVITLHGRFTLPHPIDPESAFQLVGTAPTTRGDTITYKLRAGDVRGSWTVQAK
jgi:hypothetical protein